MARRIIRTVGKLSLTNKLTYGVWNKRIPRKYKKWLKKSDIGLHWYAIFLEEYSKQPALWEDTKNYVHNIGKHLAIPYKQHPKKKPGN